jgi:transaldolase
MRTDYISRVIRDTPTRVWINNPTGDELGMALAAGAVCGTTNPSYCSKLLQREAEYIGLFVRTAAAEHEDPDSAADAVYRKVTERFMSAFLPLYRKSSGTQGFVTMQDNPNRDDDADAIINAALRHGKVGENYMAKIPVIESGMEAMTYLIERDVPICATECFSVSQAIAMCELYEQASRKSGHSPPFFITHITGIFDEEMKATVTQQGIEIEPALVAQAGCIVARKIYGLIKERRYRTTLLGGGARGLEHFTEFVGGDMHVTLNWSTIQELIAADRPVVSRIDTAVAGDIIEELSAKLPGFRCAYAEDGLSPEEFKGFAPLQRFRNSFLRGWSHLRTAIEDSRNKLAKGG